jgi:hypothetical protein
MGGLLLLATDTMIANAMANSKRMAAAREVTGFRK